MSLTIERAENQQNAKTINYSQNLQTISFCFSLDSELLGVNDFDRRLIDLKISEIILSENSPKLKQESNFNWKFLTTCVSRNFLL